jgi:cellulose biosynthesis protein BcsQ
MPIKPGEFEIIGMRAMLEVIEHFGEVHNHPMDFKVVMNLFRNGSKKHHEYLLTLNEALGDILASNTLSLAEEITDSIKTNLPVIFSNKSVAKKDFFSLAKDLVKDLKRMEEANAR